MPALNSIPTNVITGFLGAGKSTAILNLLQQKPADQRWAVLVNEFGEVGIDGSLFSGHGSEDSGIFIREVPGGCMCCAAGLPMQIALNMLLARARPDRLLIEPTGLGHPKEVLAVLTAEHYREVLDLRATVALVDARKVHDERFTNHPTFNQQLAIADVIIANKSDQYTADDLPTLQNFLHDSLGTDCPPVFAVVQGRLQPEWLAPAARHHRPEPAHQHHDQQPSVDLPLPSIQLDTPLLPEKGYLSIDNQGEGFYSRGWIFKPDWVFNAQQLTNLLLGVAAERIKAVFITDNGVFAYNKADGVLTEAELDDAMDSRIECITTDPASLKALEDALLACIQNK